MTQPIPLIKHSEPVKRIAVTAGKSREPFIAVVYATRDGDLEVLEGGKPMRWGDQMLTKYRTRYEVDISDHHLTFEFKDDLPLPTQADVYHFHASVSVSFRVADPAEVIRRNVQDAVPLVRGHLLGVCRPITRMFAIEEAEAAEAAIRARFRRDTVIQGGVSLYAVEVRLSLDEAGRKYLQEIEQAARDDKMHAARHVTDVNDLEREGRLDLLKQSRDHMLQERERLMLNGQPLDAISMVRLHLQRNPHDTEGAMKMMAALEQARFEHEQTQTDRMQQLLGAFAKDGLVNPAEVSTLVEAVVKHMEGSAGAIRASATVGTPATATPSAPQALGWNESLDDILGPTPAPTPMATPTATATVPPPAAAAEQGRPANISPVYLLVDESPGAHALPEGLDRVVADLIADLAARPQVAAAVRLGVLGFAETVETRIPLGPIPPGSADPGFTTREPADHAALFAYLRDHIPADLDVLRAQHPSVRPPVFVMLCAADPRDDAWEGWHRRLLGQVRRADIVVFGVGAATAVIAGFASYPELAFLAPGADPDRATGLFAAFLHDYIVAVGQSALDGTEPPVPDAKGFQPVSASL
ncbi:hypothetical protein Dvina_05600 [Dactylosporangium vinaceum]|uniref:VWFA domain-containing protein n=1 Tax=Dactylosporangium vinaceum TaxID=53362 RepID=A0ABV5MJA1_9ACTN|nr:hypothetical protein [Dactylosporangium vinaceum]UAB97617.1 hypothetical protein Dvina_05600 [Dactylosporangium vinaceum]